MFIDFDTFKRVLALTHSPARISVRRGVFTDGILGLAAVANSALAAGQKLDDVLYPEYQEQSTGQPIFIVAAPRSGTTMLHRLMGLDPQFTTFKLYQTIFPSVALGRVAAAIAENPMLAYGMRLAGQQLDQKAFGGWDGIHKTSLGQDEEDEATWFLSMATPALLMGVPFPDELRRVWYADHLPEPARGKLVEHFRGCVKRHLYQNPGRTLLAKNVFLPGRYNIVNEAVPNIRFVHIARHPYEVIASALSMFTKPWRYHSPDLAGDGPEVQAFARLFLEYYRFMFERSMDSQQAGDGRFYDIKYDDLVADPTARVKEIYDHFGLTLTQEYERVLAQELQRHNCYTSEHEYDLQSFGITEQQVYEALPEVFDHYRFKRCR